jgi:hypothetical protein
MNVSRYVKSYQGYKQLYDRNEESNKRIFSQYGDYDITKCGTNIVSFPQEKLLRCIGVKERSRRLLEE